MTDLSVLDDTWAWVWKEPPERVTFTSGLIVRAANGASTHDPAGFDFQANYLAWRRSFAGPLIAWTFLYAGTDPAAAASALGAVDAAAYIVDWEDWQGATANGDRLVQTVGLLRGMRPGRPIGFSSYPTRAQAEAHGVDWQAGLDSCDFVSPQMYYGYQIAAYDQVLRDAAGRYVQLDVEPSASIHWADHVGAHLDRGEGVSVWRLGILDGATRDQISLITEGHDVTKADVVAAIRDVLNLKGDLAVPAGQTSNDKLAAILLARGGDQHNEHDDLATEISALRSEVAALQAAVDDLEIGDMPPAAGGQVSGTFEGQLTVPGAQ